MSATPRTHELTVVLQPIGSIRPYAKNARTHSKEQVAKIARSIEAFGFINPILIDPEFGLIAGHGRLLAAKLLGLEEIPTITLHGLSETQKRALIIADNKIATQAGWDLDILRIELADLSLQTTHIDISLTGYSVGEVDALLVTKELPTDNDPVEPPVEARAKLGDIWQLGDHRLGCGDGRDDAFLQKVVGPDARVDAAFLDPPYNVAINGHANSKGRHREFAMASGEMTESEFQEFLSETLGACVSVSRDGAVHFVCMDWRHMNELLHAGRTVYDDLLNVCVWDKSNAGMGSLYRSKHELVFVYRVGSEQHLNNVELGKHGRNRTNVWSYASVNSLAGSRRSDLDMHPTVKPEALVADAIKDVTRRGDYVLDLFLGSGTTLIACERNGRVFRGTDIDPVYVDVAIRRWEDLTNQTATLATEGKA